MVKFLHTADIHLDSPLKGLEVHEDAPVEEIRSATRRAFDNLINLAIVRHRRDREIGVGPRWYNENIKNNLEKESENVLKLHFFGVEWTF